METPKSPESRNSVAKKVFYISAAVAALLFATNEAFDLNDRLFNEKNKTPTEQVTEGTQTTVENVVSEKDQENYKKIEALQTEFLKKVNENIENGVKGLVFVRDITEKYILWESEDYNLLSNRSIPRSAYIEWRKSHIKGQNEQIKEFNKLTNSNVPLIEIEVD